MKILVVFKWSQDPQDARVSADGAVDWQGVRMSANDDDPAAMAVARDIASPDGEIVGLTIGDGETAWAAARGASSTVVVSDARTNADSAVTGAVLAAGVRRAGDVDVVVIGDSAWDYGVVASLAGQLGWPALANVLSVEKRDGALRATRKIGSGTQIVDVTGPAVLAVVANRAEQEIPGMKAVLAARKKPVDTIGLADLAIDPPVVVSSRGTKLPDVPPAQIIDGSDPKAAAGRLMAALHAENVL